MAATFTPSTFDQWLSNVEGFQLRYDQETGSSQYFDPVEGKGVKLGGQTGDALRSLFGARTETYNGSTYIQGGSFAELNAFPAYAEVFKAHPELASDSNIIEGTDGSFWDSTALAGMLSRVMKREDGFSKWFDDNAFSIGAALFAAPIAAAELGASLVAAPVTEAVPTWLAEGVSVNGVTAAELGTSAAIGGAGAVTFPYVDLSVGIEGVPIDLAPPPPLPSLPSSLLPPANAIEPGTPSINAGAETFPYQAPADVTGTPLPADSGSSFFPTPAGTSSGLTFADVKTAASVATAGAGAAATVAKAIDGGSSSSTPASSGSGVTIIAPGNAGAAIGTGAGATTDTTAYGLTSSSSSFLAVLVIAAAAAWSTKA